MPSPNRPDAIAVITEHFGSLNAHRDLVVLRRVFDKLGWDAFTDDALAEMAEIYAWTAAEYERRTEAERPALRAAEGLPPASEILSDHSEAEAA